MNFLIIPSIFILFCISRTHSSPGTPLELVRDSSLKNNEVGKISAINDHPWIASIRWNNVHWCAGSIISENVVLSAAYCTASHWSGNLTVWVGSSSVEFIGSKHEVIAVRNDRTNKYVNIGITSDVALLKVWPPFKFGKNVKKINLANNAYIIPSPSRNTIAGWGWSKTLREVSASFVLCPRNVANQSEQFCAIPTDGNFCNGDIGGPFVTNGTQFGFMQQKPSCMKPEHPGVYLKTSYYYDWIKEKIIELENDHSWLASIQLNGLHWCAGSIISNEIILTAASCVNSKLESKYTVRVGSPSVNFGGQVYEVVDKKIHQDYVHEYPRTMNDIALLKVEPPITFNLDVGPVKLARKGYTYGPGTNSSVFGWKKVNIKHNSPQLWIAKMRIPYQCSRQYSKSRICATSLNGAGCEGEIGSPLVADGVQFGVRLSDNYCNDNHNSELFNHVPDYRDWIATNSELLIQN